MIRLELLPIWGDICLRTTYNLKYIDCKCMYLSSCVSSEMKISLLPLTFTFVGISCFKGVLDIFLTVH